MDVRKIFDLLPRYRSKYPPKPDVLAAKENGHWRKYTIDEFIENVNYLSYAFMALGLGKGDKIALIANNRPEWNFVDLAALQLGVVDVPVYPTISEHDLKFIFTDAEVKYVFVSNKELYLKVKGLGIPTIKDIYSFDKVEGVGHWSVLIELGKKNVNEAKLDQARAAVNENEMATILYTSGTTGNPKGVMLSHTNLMSNVYACRELCPVDHTGRALSFLPLNHVYERMLTYHYFYRGISVYYAESLETIGDNLKEVKPDAFSTVPRLLEKVYDKITAKGAELTGIKRALFF